MFDEPPAPRFRTTVEWRVTEVASKRLALPIQGESSDRALEEGLSKTRFLDKEVAGLFRELMAHWISMAFSAPYRLNSSPPGRGFQPFVSWA